MRAPSDLTQVSSGSKVTVSRTTVALASGAALSCEASCLTEAAKVVQHRQLRYV
jgi:hypothetical protein